MAGELSDLSFKRIRVTHPADIERLYPVLAAYVQNPSLASTVTEFVIDGEYLARTGGWIRTFGGQYQQASTPAAGPEEVAVHERIEAHARSLGLSDEATTFMLQTLSSKFQGQTSPRGGPHDRGPNSNMAFASAASTLLLSLCPNIKLLHAHDLELFPPPLTEFLLRNNYGRLPASYLQSLEHLHLQAWYPFDGREYDRLQFLDYFRYFGRLPALSTYSVEAVVQYQANREVAPPGSSPSLRKISITNSDVSSEMLGTIIRVPRALEDLTISLGGGLSHFEGGTSLVLPKTIGKCLLEHRTTLKRLDLDIASMVRGVQDEEEDEPDEDWDEEEDDRDRDEYFRLDEQAGNGRPLRSVDLPDTRAYGRTIGPLHDFEVLEHLAISVRLLVNPETDRSRQGGETAVPPFRLVDALPKALKSLHLYDYVAGQSPLADEHVQELKEKMSERFPFLTEVKGLDEPLIKNSRYNEHSGWDEKHPSELSRVRMRNRGLDWEVA